MEMIKRGIIFKMPTILSLIGMGFLLALKSMFSLHFAIGMTTLILGPFVLLTMGASAQWLKEWFIMIIILSGFFSLCGFELLNSILFGFVCAGVGMQTFLFAFLAGI